MVMALLSRNKLVLDQSPACFSAGKQWLETARTPRMRISWLVQFGPIFVCLLPISIRPNHFWKLFRKVSISCWTALVTAPVVSLVACSSQLETSSTTTVFLVRPGGMQIFMSPLQCASQQCGQFPICDWCFCWSVGFLAKARAKLSTFPFLVITLGHLSWLDAFKASWHRPEAARKCGLGVAFRGGHRRPTWATTSQSFGGTQRNSIPA